MKRQKIKPVCFNYSQLVARVKHKPDASVGETNIRKDLSALITRPIGRGSLEEIVFRMDLLQTNSKINPNYYTKTKTNSKNYNNNKSPNKKQINGHVFASNIPAIL